MLKNTLIFTFCIITTSAFSQEEIKTKPIKATKVVKVERLERASKLTPLPSKGQTISVGTNKEAIKNEEKKEIIKKD